MQSSAKRFLCNCISSMTGFMNAINKLSDHTSLGKSFLLDTKFTFIQTPSFQPSLIPPTQVYTRLSIPCTPLLYIKILTSNKYNKNNKYCSCSRRENSILIQIMLVVSHISNYEAWWLQNFVFQKPGLLFKNFRYISY